MLLRDVLERSGIVSWMTTRLSDPRSRVDVTHDLASLIRTTVLLSAQGWRDHDDADALRHDPAFRLAASSAAGLTPLEGVGLASQPTLSRFTALMAEPANLKALREAALEMAGRGIRAERQGKRLRSVTLDVDSAPIEVHGHQPKAEWNGHYNARIYHPLITSIAETGDMLDARLRAGNVGTAEGALDVILDVVDRARESFSDVAMLRIDAGFPSAALLAGLDARGIDYVSRLRANAAPDRLAAPLMKRPRCRRHAFGVTAAACRTTHVALRTALSGGELGQTAACDPRRQGTRGGPAAGSLLPGHVAGLDHKDPARGAGALSRAR